MANNHHKPEGDESPCPGCGEIMKSPTIDLVTRKSTTTACKNCGARRSIMVGEDGQPRVWN